jgi:hypothetical protein
VVRGPAPVVQREVEVLEVERHAQHGRVEEAQGLGQQLLPGLVAVQDGQRGAVGHEGRS